MSIHSIEWCCDEEKNIEFKRDLDGAEKSYASIDALEQVKINAQLLHIYNP